MRVLWHSVIRFCLVVGTLIPIWWSYLWLYVRGRWLRIPASDARWTRAHQKNARRFYRTAVRMRGGLIKVGQIISTRVDLVPQPWLDAMTPLQDRAPPMPWDELAASLTEALGGHPDEVFASIDHEAVAAASFGQVHRARTRDGRDVALKIQYADIEMKLRCDLAAMRLAIPLINRFVPKVPLKAIFSEVGEALQAELDYVREADFTERIGANMAELEHVVVPQVVREHTSGRVLCTTYFEGIKITDSVAVREAKLDTHDIIQKTIRAYAKMFFVDGVFQSDPHPGNLMVRRATDGTADVCILDFGQVKVLPPDFQRKLIASAMAFMFRDVDGFARAVVSMGMMNERDVAVARPIMVEFFEEMFEMSPEDLRELDLNELKKKVLATVEAIEAVHIPQDVVLYGRAFSLLSGVVTQLDPSVNGLVLAKPMIMEALMRPENFAPPPVLSDDNAAAE